MVTEKNTEVKAKAPKKNILKESSAKAVKSTNAAVSVEKLKASEKKVKAIAASSKVGTVKVKQIASGAGRLKKQIATLKGLGLNKINREVELEDTVSIRGMINKVKHLVKVI